MLHMLGNPFRWHFARMPVVGILLSVVETVAFAPSASGRTEATDHVPDIVLDTDVDFDDVAALAYLAEAYPLGLIHLRAVTVSIAGFAPAGIGLGDAHCLFRKLGLVLRCLQRAAPPD